MSSKSNESVGLIDCAIKTLLPLIFPSDRHLTIAMAGGGLVYFSTPISQTVAQETKDLGLS